jgi:hypothetical protein
LGAINVSGKPLWSQRVGGFDCLETIEDVSSVDSREVHKTLFHIVKKFTLVQSTWKAWFGKCAAFTVILKSNSKINGWEEVWVSLPGFSS